MKILLINSVFFPAIEWGGPVTATYDLARKLAENGHDVTVYTGDARDYDTNINRLERKVVEKEDFKVYYFKNWSRHFRYFFTPGMIIPLLKHAKEFDIIHVNSYRQFQDMMSFIILSLIGKPFVLTSHGYVLPDGKGQLYKKTYDFFIGRKLLSSAKKIIAFTEKQREDYQKMGVNRNNIKIIPNTIDIEKLPTKGNLKKFLNLPDTVKIVMYLGRIDEDKGIRVLIEAFTKIKMENVHLVIAGKDFGFEEESKKLLKKILIENRVHFTGLLDKERKLQAFVDADIVVYPSLHEAGISMVILEAAAAARPLIISDAIGFAKEAIEYHAAITCPPNNIEKLYEEIQRLLVNSEEAEKMGLRAQQVIKEKFSWNSALQQHIEVYNEVIKNN